MDYFFLGIAVICIGFQFVCTKIYQKRSGTALVSNAVFGLVAGAASCLAFAAFRLFSVRINLFSALVALALAASTTVCNCAGIKAMSCGKVAVFTQFMMLGGMLVPFLYGVVVWREHAGVWRYIALVLLVASLVLPCTECKGQKNSALFYLLCILGFVCNGAVSVLSKTHQISARAVPTFDFMVAVYGFTAVLNGLLLAAASIAGRGKKKKEIGQSASAEPSDKKKLAVTAGVILLYAAVSAGGFVMQLLGARNLPAVLLYPVVTGGTVILSAVLGRLFFGEKISKPVLGGIALAFAATCLFLI